MRGCRVRPVTGTTRAAADYRTTRRHQSAAICAAPPTAHHHVALQSRGGLRPDPDTFLVMGRSAGGPQKDDEESRREWVPVSVPLVREVQVHVLDGVGTAKQLQDHTGRRGPSKSNGLYRPCGFDSPPAPGRGQSSYPQPLGSPSPRDQTHAGFSSLAAPRRDPASRLRPVSRGTCFARVRAFA